MKKLFTLIFVVAAFMAQAQYTTPGTGVSWNLDSLVVHSGGTVILNNDHYEITSTLTLATGDTLSILDDVTVLLLDLAGIESTGVFTINAPVQAVFNAIDTTSTSAWRGFRLGEGHVTHIKNATLKFGGGIRTINGTFFIDSSTIYKNYYKSGSTSGSYTSAAAVDMMGGGNVTNCKFISNVRGAVASGSSACRAYIRNNYMFGNVTLNSNRPQINMGAAGLNDTTFIIGNTVIGNGSTLSGGIGYSALTGVSGSVVIDSNYVELNRYGITLTGSPINGAIRYNTLINNNIQNDPSLGGSGINFTASSPTATLNATVTGNIIDGHLWGITIIGYPKVNMGDSAAATFNPGGNIFTNNGNGGVHYDLYNNGPVNQTAMYNKWNVSVQDSVSIDSVIVHLADITTLGRVDFMPSYALPTYFAANNIQGEPLAGVEITVENNQQILLTGSNGNAFAMLAPGIHNFTATLDGYAPYNGAFTVVPGDNHINFTMLIPAYQLTFSVTNPENTPLQNVYIVVEGQAASLLTNDLGVATVELPDGIYNYTASLENFISANGSIEISGASVTVFIVLQPVAPTLYTVTFNVSGAYGSIEGAEIQINGTTLFTNALGVATLELADGSYPFSATVTGYSVEEGIVIVIGANVEVIVFLNTGIEKLFSQQITIYPNPVEELLFIKGAKIDAIEIYSIGGAMMMRFDQVMDFVNLRALNAGSYFLKLYSGDNVARKLLMKR